MLQCCGEKQGCEVTVGRLIQIQKSAMITLIYLLKKKKSTTKLKRRRSYDSVGQWFPTFFVQPCQNENTPSGNLVWFSQI